MLKRRGFLGSIAAFGAGVFMRPAWAGSVSHTLRPEALSVTVGETTQTMFGFNGSWPGPELRVGHGDDVSVRVDNRLDEGTLVHWHGLRLPNRMDGVNVLTQEVIPPSRTFDYRFTAKDAGTFWYHSHYIAFDQVSRGLFGPLIVEEAAPPDVDFDLTVQLFDLLVDDEGQYQEDFPADQFTGAGRMGNVVRALMPVQPVQQGARLRLRLINPSIDRVYRVQIGGVDGHIVALDGMPLLAPRAVGEIVLAPGQRCDVIGDVTGDVVLFDGGARIGQVSVNGARARRNIPLPTLRPNTMPQPSSQPIQATLTLQGGAGGGGHGGFGTWALNDVSGLPRSPLVDVRRGTSVRLRIENATGFDHVMHLHGHHFWELDPTTDAVGDYRDGTFIRAGGTRDILCVLDNPGDWMLHCHMLSHQADGMGTWLRVR